MATEGLKDDTYAYCPGECGAQVTKARTMSSRRKTMEVLLCVVIPTTLVAAARDNR